MEGPSQLNSAERSGARRLNGSGQIALRCCGLNLTRDQRKQNNGQSDCCRAHESLCLLNGDRNAVAHPAIWGANVSGEFSGQEFCVSFFSSAGPRREDRRQRRNRLLRSYRFLGRMQPAQTRGTRMARQRSKQPPLGTSVYLSFLL